MKQLFCDKVLTYPETCAICKTAGVIPCENPTPSEIQQFKLILKRCLEHYEPDARDVKLAGVFLFDPSEQGEKLSASDGYAFSKDGRRAFVGLDVTLLQMPRMFEYTCIVFLHELCHLHTWQHNDDFYYRFGAVIYNFYRLAE